jgi:hypothetical protein
MKILRYEVGLMSDKQATLAMLYILVQLLIDRGLGEQIGNIFSRLNIKYTVVTEVD